MAEPEGKGPEDAGAPGDPSLSPRDDGVDVSLIRWMLSLTPQERLQVLQESVNSLLRMRDGQSRS